VVGFLVSLFLVNDMAMDGSAKSYIVSAAPCKDISLQIFELFAVIFVKG
jgi:hypothetical protein